MRRSCRFSRPSYRCRRSQTDLTCAAIAASFAIGYEAASFTNSRALERVKPSSTRLSSRFASQVGDDLRKRTVNMPELEERKRTESRVALAVVFFVERLVAMVPSFTSRIQGLHGPIKRLAVSWSNR